MKDQYKYHVTKGELQLSTNDKEIVLQMLGLKLARALIADVTRNPSKNVRPQNRKKVIDVLSASPEGISTAEISNKTGMAKSTSSRVIRLLSDEGKLDKIGRIYKLKTPATP